MTDPAARPVIRRSEPFLARLDLKKILEAEAEFLDEPYPERPAILRARWRKAREAQFAAMRQTGGPAIS